MVIMIYFSFLALIIARKQQLSRILGFPCLCMKSIIVMALVTVSFYKGLFSLFYQNTHNFFTVPTVPIPQSGIHIQWLSSTELALTSPSSGEFQDSKKSEESMYSYSLEKAGQNCSLDSFRKSLDTDIFSASSLYLSSWRSALFSIADRREAWPRCV